MVLESTFYRFTSVVNVSRCWEITSSSELQNFSGVLTTTHVGYLASKLIDKAMSKGGKILTKLWCCVGGRV